MKLLAALVLALSCAAGHASAVWDVDISNSFGSDAPFALVGTFTTADANIDRGFGEAITSFSGTFDGAPVSLVLLGESICATATCDETFLYNNVFFGAPAPGWTIDDSFNSDGLLLTYGVDNYVNVFSEGQLIDFDHHADGTSSIVFASGTLSFDRFSAPAVPEPAIAWLLIAGVLLAAMKKPRLAGLLVQTSTRTLTGTN